MVDAEKMAQRALAVKAAEEARKAEEARERAARLASNLPNQMAMVIPLLEAAVEQAANAGHVSASVAFDMAEVESLVMHYSTDGPYRRPVYGTEIRPEAVHLVDYFESRGFTVNVYQHDRNSKFLSLSTSVIQNR